MKDCIFCKIAAGELPASVVYEDNQVVAFLDIHPLRPGHTLVIPKVHDPDLHHLDDGTFDAVMRASKRIAGMIERTLSPKRVGFLVAGWDVPHAHVHVVPMEDALDLTSNLILTGKRGSPDAEELERVRVKLALG